MKSKPYNPFLKYTQIGLQMIAVILAGTFGGQKLDSLYSPETNIFTLIFIPLSVFIAIFLALKDFIKLK